MSRWIRWTLPMVAAIGLMVLASQGSRAADEAKGKISGSLVDKDGKAVPSASVALMNATDMPTRNKGDNAAGQPKAQRPKAVAKTTADADGKFTFSDVAPGDYVVVAAVKGVSNGREKVTVKSGDTASVTVTMKARGEKKNK